MGNAENSNIVIYIERGQLDVLVSNDPILKDKELIAVYNGNELIGHKIGNGVSKWSELDYISLDTVDEFKVFDKLKGYVCKIVLNPVDKVQEIK